MDNNVVSGVFKKLIQNDITCLRFNFRAVGRSTGKHSSGRGELSDTKACVDFLVEEKKCEEILLCGYSYGAAIGCSAVNHSDNIIGYVAISFPWDFMGPKYKKLSQSTKPKLFIQGDRDDIAKYDQFLEHFEFYNEPKEYKIINGADHFYRGYETLVADNVFEYCQSLT